MRAVVLPGGMGTRLRPYTTVIPKPLVPVGARPVLEHIIRSLSRCGVDRVDLCVNHLGELILVYLANAELPPDLRLAFHWEREPLGTAGALATVPDPARAFLGINGDVLTTPGYPELIPFHHQRGAGPTLPMHRKQGNNRLRGVEAGA